MPELTDDSTPIDGGTPPPAASGTDAAAAGSKATEGSDDSTLASRYAGQTAKVNVLTTQNAAAEARALAAEERLKAYEAGKVGADEALKSQLEVEKQNTAAALRTAAMTRIEAKYPETFAELGEDAAGLSDEKLAAIEARLKGVAAEEEPRTPAGAAGNANDNRLNGGANAKKTDADKSYADVRAEFVSGKLPAGWG